jgi:hypothetical protein
VTNNQLQGAFNPVFAVLLASQSNKIRWDFSKFDLLALLSAIGFATIMIVGKMFAVDWLATIGAGALMFFLIALGLRMFWVAISEILFPRTSHIKMLQESCWDSRRLSIELCTTSVEDRTFALKHIERRHALLEKRIANLGVAQQAGFIPAILAAAGAIATAIPQVKQVLGSASSLPNISTLGSLILYIYLGMLLGVFVTRSAILGLQKDIYAIQDSLEVI